MENAELNLLPEEELFCQEYIIDLNRSKAYLRAYPQCSPDSARSLGSRMVSKVNIRARIRQLMDARSKVTLVDAEYVVTKLLEVHDKCIQPEPIMVYDPVEKEMKQLRNEYGELVFQFDSNGANKALELLGKHCGAFTADQKLDLTLNGLPSEQFAQLLQAAKNNAAGGA